MADFEYTTLRDYVVFEPCSPAARALWPDVRQHPAFAVFDCPIGDCPPGAEVHKLFWAPLRDSLRRAGYTVRRAPRCTMTDDQLLAALSE